jgi:demethylmenaquinone methyltransferase/2-methoxy-6-polyprenyl-1,4-benzoquinol methylase
VLHADNILDLCCGTGDIAFKITQTSKRNPKLSLLDFAEEMIAIAKKRLPEASCIVGDAQMLPFHDARFDAVTLAYGIRNVQDEMKCLREVFRVLSPQGVLAIVELTRPQKPLSWLHHIYLNTVLPLVGKWLCRNKQAYEYLQSSIQSFISPDELIEKARSIGFRCVKKRSLCFGIATLIVLEKPCASS